MSGNQVLFSSTYATSTFDILIGVTFNVGCSFACLFYILSTLYFNSKHIFFSNVSDMHEHNFRCL